MNFSQLSKRGGLSIALLVGAAVCFPIASNAAVIAQYHFDESSGSTTSASIGSVNGTLSTTGSSFVGGGISGNAISLDRAANGYVNLGNNFGFTSGDFSIVYWLKTTTTLTDSAAIGKHEAFTVNGYFSALNNTGGGGSPNKATFNVSEFVSSSPTSTTTINDGLWHQVVGVYVAGGTHSIYVDGTPVEASSSSSAMIANSAPFLVGGVNQSGTPNGRYTGLIDELQIYNQALNNSQIDFLYSNPSQTIASATTSVPEPFTIIGTLIGGTAALRMRKKLKSTSV
jgi:Concanavalin A-like lectin/glucanases superfamily